MKKLLLGVSFYLFCALTLSAQNVNLNGQIDDFGELCTKQTMHFTMPDGIILESDMYLPILRDCLLVPISIPNPFDNNNPFTANLQVLPRGKQIIIYDSLNGQPNPNPFQLPIVFSRTPYAKGSFATEAAAVCLLGNAYIYQDMRGRYESQGVYLPLMSDGWNKNPYHPMYKHVLDITDTSDARNGNRHEDGYNSIQFILDSLYRQYDIDGDGTMETFNPGIGRIAMFGASALGYNQFQAAAAHKINPTQPGLKALFPIVAPGEFFNSTGFVNGVFRDRLVTGWLKGQIFTSTDDDLIPIDSSIDNNIHTSRDYLLPNKFQAANLSIDHFATVRYAGGPAGYYPNSIGRADMDISRAMVNSQGEGDANGTVSRYTNMEVPAFNLTGWYDIFIDGQIQTWANMRKHLNPAYNNRKLQKIVIGPWAHQTTGSQTTGDVTYPSNVGDILGFDLGEIDVDNIPIGKILNSDLISWFRYNLNYDTTQFIGEPKVLLPESPYWQDSPIQFVKIRFPAEDIKLTLPQLLAFMNGTGGIDNVKIELKLEVPLLPPATTSLTIPIPALGSPLIDGLGSDAIPPAKQVDFLNDVPNVRFYVIGPIEDGVPENTNMGNYWFPADTFPLVDGITWNKFYMHTDGKFNPAPPASEEGFVTYVHDPDDPIATIGGNNMIERTPDGLRDSQGQFNLADERYSDYTMTRPGVVSFQTDIIQDSLCVIGFPIANIWAKSNPNGLTSGPTDTDFFIRILDVYPDGKELYVTEGAVNARARDYARGLAENPAADENYPYPNDDVPFTNIEANQLYEYKFKMYPLGYTFGKGHRVKILISSSNFTRYQVNPNLPIEDGDFFRRKPGDGQTYVFNNTEMEPRVAVQRLHISDMNQCWIDLPVYSQNILSADGTPVKDIAVLEVFPNPTADLVNLYMNRNSQYSITVYNIQGQQVLSTTVNGNQTQLDVRGLNNGIYSIRVIDTKTGKVFNKKLSKI